MKIRFIILAFFLLFWPAYSLAENQAAVVIVHSDGQVKQACVSFAEKAISGYDLLARAGFAPQQDRGFVVEIDKEKTKSAWEMSAGDKYWSYWKLKDNKWIYSPVGALTSEVSAGQVDGWKISPSNTSFFLLSFEEICPSQTTLPSPEIAAAQIKTSSLATATASVKGVSETKLSSPKEAEKKQVKGAAEERKVSAAEWLSAFFSGPLSFKKVFLVLGVIFLFNLLVFGAFALLKNRCWIR